MRAPALPDALPVSEDAPVERLIARVVSAQRLRTLHATVLGRAQTLKDERNIIAELPAGDPLDDATVLLVGRGRHHATLSVAVGERMGVIGALERRHRRAVPRGARGRRRPDRRRPAGERGRSFLIDMLGSNALRRELPVGLLGALGDVAGAAERRDAPAIRRCCCSACCR